MVINGIYKHKRSSTPGKVPLATDLSPGEIAINTADAILYTKVDNGAVIALNQSYSRVDSDNRFVPQGILPITRVGTLDNNPLPVATASGFTFSVTGMIPVILGGRFYTIQPGSYTISNVDNGATTDLTNKTINVYLALVDSTVKFAYFTAAQGEAYALVFIGTITTTSAITAVNVAKVSRLDIYRVSLTSRGAAIPVTSGLPSGSGTFDPSWGI